MTACPWQQRSWERRAGVGGRGGRCDRAEATSWKAGEGQGESGWAARLIRCFLVTEKPKRQRYSATTAESVEISTLSHPS